MFEKYKKQPYYFDTLFLNVNNNPLHNQRTLSNYILNDFMLLDFLQTKTNHNVVIECICVAKQITNNKFKIHIRKVIHKIRVISVMNALIVF